MTARWTKTRYFLKYLLAGVFLLCALLLFKNQFFPVSALEDKNTKFLETTPRWLNPKCSEMNKEEYSQQELAVKVLTNFPEIDDMHIGAVRYLGRTPYRVTGPYEVSYLCLPKDLYDKVFNLAVSQNIFRDNGYFFEEELNLARNLGPRNSRIIEGVALIAFNSEPIKTEDQYNQEDIRALARTVMAEFGEAALPWTEQAFKEINSTDMLGTSAAQIAVATNHPQALQRVSELLENILKEYPEDPIPREARNRFYELAYALAIAGPKAQSYISPVLKIMNRKVESAAPPFGLIPYPPRKMCLVLGKIGGQDADKILSQPICDVNNKTYEQ